MKLIAPALSLLLLSGAIASAQTLDDLKNDGKNTDNILTYGMGYGENRYSPLKQIDKTNIKRLVPVWNLSLDNQWGEQAQPIVYDGVMYVTNAKATVAIDVGTGKQLWKTDVDWLPETPRVVCCGVSSKGAAIYNGKIFRTTLDAYVVALDAKTGKQIWKSKAAEWRDGYSMTVAPLVADGVVITGISGAEYGIRGFIDGWDPETGKQLWRRYTIPARGEKGNETWPQDNDSWQHGGGSSWITGSFDPDLDLTYWGTGGYPNAPVTHGTTGAIATFTVSSSVASASFGWSATQVDPPATLQVMTLYNGNPLVYGYYSANMPASAGTWYGWMIFYDSGGDAVFAVIATAGQTMQNGTAITAAVTAT